MLINQGYTPAFIGLARARALLGEYWHAPSDLSFPAARRAIS